MKRLYFIRHGQSEMNVSELFAGVTDTPLTEVGKKQAAKAGEHAMKLSIDHIISSPMSRAYDTAKIIAEKIGYPVKDISLNSLFMERNYGALEGTPWSPGIDADGIADFEQNKTLLARARQALDFLESLEDENIMVVSHGSFGRALRHHIKEDFPISRYHRIPNAEIIQLL